MRADDFQVNFILNKTYKHIMAVSTTRGKLSLAALL